MPPEYHDTQESKLGGFDIAVALLSADLTEDIQNFSYASFMSATHGISIVYFF